MSAGLNKRHGHVSRSGWDICQIVQQGHGSADSATSGSAQLIVHEHGSVDYIRVCQR
jgi:hypothetical protein